MSHRLRVAATILFHSSCAIAVTLVSKTALNGINAPVTLLALQTIVQVVMLTAVGIPLGWVAVKKPLETWKVFIPLAIARVVGVLAKTYCLAAVEASFYQIARGLLLPFTLLLSFLFLGKSFADFPPLAILGCMSVIGGFGIGMVTDMAKMSTSTLGLALGVGSSLTTAIESVVVKVFVGVKAKQTGEGMIQMVWMSNVISIFLYAPIMLVSGEYKQPAIRALLSGSPTSSGRFFATCMLTGVFSFLLTLATFLQISVTSPTTHMIVTAARGVALSAFAVWLIPNESMTSGKVWSMAFILGGSAIYGWAEDRAMVAKQQGGELRRPRNSGFRLDRRVVRMLAAALSFMFVGWLWGSATHDGLWVAPPREIQQVYEPEPVVIPVPEITPELSDAELFTKQPTPVSYDLTTPPSTGCERIVDGLRSKLMETYTPLFEGIRYINIWGYLETENKGDAAIWVAQQILLAELGIETMAACRYASGNYGPELCDMKDFRKRLEDHKPNSGIVMAGGGNFNDYYWSDQPARIEMVGLFPDYPVRAFPQSIWMRNNERIKLTVDAFTPHPDLQLGARDQASYDWLYETFGPSEKNNGIATQVKTTLTPDIVFMYGNRPEFRKIEKKYDIFILARVDREVSALSGSGLPQEESGTMQLGKHTVSYLKKDWNFLPTPGLTKAEKGKSQRAYLKAVEGFRILGRSEFVITDRLHGHIMSTIIGTPHVLLDSKLGKNLALHDTWTSNCDCVRIAESTEQALDVAEMWFDKAYNEGRWSPGA